MESKVKLLDAHYESYRARNADAFFQFFDENCEFYAIKDGVMTPRTNFKEGISKLFESSPQLDVHVLEREIMGQYIKDREVVTGIGPSSKKIDCWTIYFFRGEKIHTVWFFENLIP